MSIPHADAVMAGPADIIMFTPEGKVTNGAARLNLTPLTASNTGVDATGLGVPGAPYRSLSRALQDASRGDVVELLSGDFPEPAGVTVPGGVTVFATGPTTITGNGAAGVIGMTLSGDAVVSDLVVRGFAEGIYATGTLDPAAQVVLRSVDVLDSTQGAGLTVGGNTDLLVERSASPHDSTFQGNAGGGIILADGVTASLRHVLAINNLGTGLTLVHNVVALAEDLTSSGNGADAAANVSGVDVRDAAVLTLTGSRMENNRASGIVTHGMFTGTLTVTGSTISTNGMTPVSTVSAGGVVLLGSAGTVVVDSTTLAGNFTGIKIVYDAAVTLQNGTDVSGSLGHGITMANGFAGGLTLDNVRVRDNATHGIWMDSCGPDQTITLTNGTQITGNRHGVELQCGALNCQQSTLADNRLDGIYAVGTTVTTLTGCHVDNNGLEHGTTASGVELKERASLTMQGGTASNNWKAGVVGMNPFQGHLGLTGVTLKGNGAAGGNTVAGVQVYGVESTVSLTGVKSEANAVGLIIRGAPVLMAVNCEFVSNTFEGAVIQSFGAYDVTFDGAAFDFNGKDGLMVTGTGSTATGRLSIHNATFLGNAFNSVSSAGMTLAGNNPVTAYVTSSAVGSNYQDGVRVENVKATLRFGDDTMVCADPLDACPHSVSFSSNVSAAGTTWDTAHADFHDARVFDAVEHRMLLLSNALFEERTLMRGGTIYGNSASESAPVQALGPLGPGGLQHYRLLIDDGRNAVQSW